MSHKTLALVPVFFSVFLVVAVAMSYGGEDYTPKPVAGLSSDTMREKEKIKGISEFAEAALNKLHPGLDQYVAVMHSVRDSKRYALYFRCKRDGEILGLAISVASAIQEKWGNRYVNELVMFWYDKGNATALKGEGIAVMVTTKDPNEMVAKFVQYAIPNFQESQSPLEVREWLRSVGK